MSQFQNTKGSIWRARRVWLKRPIIPKWESNYYSLLQCTWPGTEIYSVDRTIQFLNNSSLAYSEYFHIDMAKCSPKLYMWNKTTVRGCKKWNILQSGEHILDCFTAKNCLNYGTLFMFCILQVLKQSKCFYLLSLSFDIWVTCDQAALLPFLFERRKEKHARYIYFTCRLPPKYIANTF